MKPGPLVSIVVPVLNEEEAIGPFFEAVRHEAQSLEKEGYRFEFVVTDNHSTDQTFSKLVELASQDLRIRVIRFSRNFGYQKSILTGYQNARGDCAIQLDCDLQDPPSLIRVFLKHWESGYRVVYGVRRTRNEGFWISAIRKLFYRIIDFMSEDELPVDAGDFRLVDRCILEELKKSRDAQPYLRGQIAAMGFAQMPVPYDRQNRQRGQSKFNFFSLLTLALDGILNHSVVPLRLATYLGIFTALITFVGSMTFFIGKLVFAKAWPAGFATLAVITSAGISLNAMFFGILGEYLGRLYKQAKQGPLVIVETTLGPDGKLELSQRRAAVSPAREINTEVAP